MRQPDDIPSYYNPVGYALGDHIRMALLCNVRKALIRDERVKKNKIFQRKRYNCPLMIAKRFGERYFVPKSLSIFMLDSPEAIRGYTPRSFSKHEYRLEVLVPGFFTLRGDGKCIFCKALI